MNCFYEKLNTNVSHEKWTLDIHMMIHRKIFLLFIHYTKIKYEILFKKNAEVTVKNKIFGACHKGHRRTRTNQIFQANA